MKKVLIKNKSVVGCPSTVQSIFSFGNVLTPDQNKPLSNQGAHLESRGMRTVLLVDVGFE